MIRIGLPPPVLPRLRLHWHSTQTLFSRQARGLRETVTRTTTASQAWRQRVQARLTGRLGLRARAMARQRAQLACFEAKFEELVDLLCWAAKEGVRAEHEARYGELRVWMRVHYRAIAPRLRPHWVEPDASDAADPFRALFASADIEEVINAAMGIENMMQTRGALEAYRATLETPEQSARL